VASGQWRDGKLHGRSKIVFPNGDRYEGDFVVGEKSGLGAYTWADGRVFEGDNGLSGLGVMWNKEGQVVDCGRWARNELVESRPVPRSKIPIGSRLAAHGSTTTLQLHCSGGSAMARSQCLRVHSTACSDRCSAAPSPFCFIPPPALFIFL